MSARVTRYLLERLTALELNLMQRFSRRALDIYATLEATQRRCGIPGATLGDVAEATPSAGRCLGGLEVTYVSGSTIHVSPGAMLLPNSSPATETRPGTWSGNVEADDASYMLARLPVSANAAPGVAIPGALADDEMWVVYVTPSEVTVETDSQRRVFNETTGVFDAASAAKVKQHQLTAGVIRGSAGGAVPYGSVPTGGKIIALLWVPAGATDLSTAVIFDCRKLIDQSPGPNEILGGSWKCAHIQSAVTPYHEAIFQGSITARIGGELVSARTRLGGTVTSIRVGDIKEPGASWPAATSSTPQFAWLYVVKPLGLVPRPVRRGALPVCNDPLLNDSVMFDGALVLSPTPPKIGCASGASGTGHRWDLRPSATLALPSFQRGDIAYRYAGLTATADHAICVGFLRYVDVDSGTPVIYGDLHVSDDGWVSGRAINSATTNPTEDGDGLDAAGLFDSFGLSTDSVSAPRVIKATILQSEVTVGADTWTFPMTAARFRVKGDTSDSTHPIYMQYDDHGIVLHPVAETYQHITERHVACPGQKFLEVIKGIMSTATFSASTLDVSVIAVRWPYRTPLVT